MDKGEGVRTNERTGEGEREEENAKEEEEGGAADAGVERLEEADE